MKDFVHRYLYTLECQADGDHRRTVEYGKAHYREGGTLSIRCYDCQREERHTITDLEVFMIPGDELHTRLVRQAGERAALRKRLKKAPIDIGYVAMKQPTRPQLRLLKLVAALSALEHAGDQTALIAGEDLTWVPRQTLETCLEYGWITERAVAPFEERLTMTRVQGRAFAVTKAGYELLIGRMEVQLFEETT